MAEKRRSSRSKTLSFTINGPADANAAFIMVIGQLIVNWANNESVFLAMLQNLLCSPTHHQAAIIWHSHKNTRARLQIIDALARDRISDQELLEDILRASGHFYTQTKIRNFYAHAIYLYDEDLALKGAQAFEISEKEPVVSESNKVFNKATLNEMVHTSIQLSEHNRHLWQIVFRIGECLGGQHAHIPEIVRQDKPQG